MRLLSPPPAGAQGAGSWRHQLVLDVTRKTCGRAPLPPGHLEMTGCGLWGPRTLALFCVDRPFGVSVSRMQGFANTMPVLISAHAPSTSLNVARLCVATWH